MAKTYEQIQRQIAELQAEAEKLRKKELGGVIARIREAIDHYDLTAGDLGLSAGGRRKSVGPGRGRRKGKAVAKSASDVAFRDSAGNTWVGRGKRPQWLRDALIAGRSLDEFRVKPN